MGGNSARHRKKERLIMTKIETEIIELGHIGVDSGTMMLCDPCYVMGRDTKSWENVCNEIKDGREGMILRVNDSDYADGSVFSTGFGDGSYPVEIEVGDFGELGKRVVSAKITFIDDEEMSEMSDLK
jgi:hypothetical protein